MKVTSEARAAQRWLIFSVVVCRRVTVRPSIVTTAQNAWQNDGGGGEKSGQERTGKVRRISGCGATDAYPMSYCLPSGVRGESAHSATLPAAAAATTARSFGRPESGWSDNPAGFVAGGRVDLACDCGLLSSRSNPAAAYGAGPRLTVPKHCSSAPACPGAPPLPSLPSPVGRMTVVRHNLFLAEASREI